jgi:hypothetical protein
LPQRVAHICQHAFLRGKVVLCLRRGIRKLYGGGSEACQGMVNK